MKKWLAVLPAALLLFVFAACAGGTDKKDPIEVEGVTLDRTEATLKIGETVKLTATVSPADASDKTVTWTSSSPETAKAEGGTVTALKSGTATITAQAGSAKATCNVKVLSPGDRITIGGKEYASLTAAVAAAQDGETVEVSNGEYTIDEPLAIGKKITLRGEAGYTTFKTAQKEALAIVTAEDVTIEGIGFVKTDKETAGGGFAMISVRSDNFTLKNCTFTAQYADGDNEVTRAVVPYAGVSGYLIEGNTFKNIRQPAYLEGEGTVKNNHTEGTRGFVVCCNHKVTFEGNTFASNAVDIAIIENAGAQNLYTEEDTLSISTKNNGAYVQNQPLTIDVKNGQKQSK